MTERIFNGVGQPTGTGVTGVRVLDRFSRRFRRLLDPADRVDYALNLAADTFTLAVTLHDDTPAQHAGLDLNFAHHLTNHRNLVLQQERRAVVCSGTRPDLDGSEDAVRVPHMLLSRPHMRAQIQDTVIWEVMSHDHAREWLDGQELPDQIWYEQHLSQILHLRRAHRRGLLADTELARQIGTGYLSIRFAYLNPEVIRAHLADHADAAGEDGAGR